MNTPCLTGCHCDCGYLHVAIEKYSRSMKKLALERKRGKVNYGLYCGTVARLTIATANLALCNWCQDEVVCILHEVRKVADHGFRLLAKKNQEDVIDLTVDE